MGRFSHLTDQELIAVIDAEIADCRAIRSDLDNLERRYRRAARRNRAAVFVGDLIGALCVFVMPWAFLALAYGLGLTN